MSKRERLMASVNALTPEHVEVVDESHMHSRGLESHYKLVLVSPVFEGLNAVRRHQKVYACLGGLMQEIHALALHTYTPQEWQGQAPASPTCLGGSQHDH